jgi:hypothetical protein
MRGALITIRCDCGDVGRVAHGEQWGCASCGRTWSTEQIPAEEYWEIMRNMRRLRLSVVGTMLLLVVPIAALTAFAGVRILLLLPVVMAFWYMFYMPRWRRKAREQARSLQRWKLYPE